MSSTERLPSDVWPAGWAPRAHLGGGGTSQGAQQGCPASPGPKGAQCSPFPAEPPRAVSSHPCRMRDHALPTQGAAAQFLYHHQITDAAPETKAGAIGFPRKMCFAESNLQLICIKLLYQSAWEYRSASDRFRGWSPRKRDTPVFASVIPATLGHSFLSRDFTSIVWV